MKAIHLRNGCSDSRHRPEEYLTDDVSKVTCKKCREGSLPKRIHFKGKGGCKARVRAGYVDEEHLTSDIDKVTCQICLRNMKTLAGRLLRKEGSLEEDEHFTEGF